MLHTTEDQTSTAKAAAPVLVEVQNMRVHFPLRGGILGRPTGEAIKAIDDISFSIYEGETLGLVGESGCGKSTTGRAILQLRRPTSGSVHFQGRDLASASEEEMRSMRREMQMIYQDPYSSLNPRMSIGDAIAEPIRIHGLRKGSAAIDERVRELLELVGLAPDFAQRYPHEFSGGQRQRVGIARALAMEPKFLVCDEPVSALDVSIQAQVINLLEDLQARLGLTYLFIAHGLAVVKHISDRIAVMYLGKIVELGKAADLYTAPKHPYTRSLLSAVPIPDPKVEKTRKRIILQGDIPSPLNPPSGCRFHTRCPMATAKCAAQEPSFSEVSPGHYAACWRSDEIDEMDAIAHSEHHFLGVRASEGSTRL
ncbi:ABC transporter ATP-binding protein [Ensifer sp. YR511]|uniref:ABC transporter ATP-binding protein n=1 Tax=Ensifer sp. YR511 TaxID=1855294 RepID=UPI000B7E57E5|nr:oligopeptide/dipeptide ABC transporter ATP-binding protein [Ensifer sp. YR511]